MSGRPTRAALAAVLITLGARPARAQGYNRYENMYGPAADVTITDLVEQATSYEGRAVHTKGLLDFFNSPGARRFVLRDGFQHSVLITPIESQGVFESEAMTYLGKEVEVTGLFRARNDSGSLAPGVDNPGGIIQFWKYLGPPEKPKGPIQAKLFTLEQLLTTPGRRDGQIVKVVGQFRGRNLFGDLPARSERAHGDWVIKDDVFAVWVTGKKPKGAGWELDLGMKRDSGKWVEVIGRPDTRNGVVYLQALEVALSGPPSANAQAAPPPPPPEKPKVAPIVVFTLPLDGDVEIATDARFVVQFSKDMDEQSFKDRVLLRYVGPMRPGDRPFDGMKVSYDGGRRALTVDPGDVLLPGRTLELVLLPGISDTDGLALVSRPGRSVEEAADVLHFKVSS